MLKIDQLLKRPETESSVSNATFDRPLELLSSCHEKILHFSSTLLKLSAALKQEGWNDDFIATAEQIQRYFNIAAPEHHHDEELHLFPAIISLDPEFKNPQTPDLVKTINLMIKEHVESDALWEALNSMLEERTENFNELEQLAIQFEAAIREHAQIENETIFPFAEKNISAKEFKKMGAEIAKRRGIYR